MLSFRYPAVVILISVIIGTLLGRFIDISYLWFFAACLLAFISLVFIYRGYRRLIFSIALIIAFFGMAELHASRVFFPGEEFSVAGIAGAGEHKPVRIFGVIDKWPVLKQHRTLLSCHVDSVVMADSVHRVSGKVLLRVNRVTTEFILHDKISVAGRLHPVEPSSEIRSFDYGHWLANQGIQATMRINDPAKIMIDPRARGMFPDLVDRMRSWILGVFIRYLDEIPAAMSGGYLIGETRHIPEDIYQAFRTTGTMHLLAVSGSNVALVLLVALFILRPFRVHRFVRLGLLLVLIIVFSHLSYNQPSVVRASVMAILVLVGRTLYRRVDLHNIIAAAAVLLLLYNPSNLFDVGFQLSFAVTWGLVLFLPVFYEIIMQRMSQEWLRYILLIIFCSVIASVVAVPITAYYFGEFAVVTVFSNLLVVPLVSLSVIGIVVLLLLAALYPPLAAIPAMPLNIILDITNQVVLWFDSWRPIRDAHVYFSGFDVCLSLIGATLMFLSLRYKFTRRLFVFFVLTVIITVNALAVWAGDETKGEVLCFNTGTVFGVYADVDGGFLALSVDRQNNYDVLTTDILPYIERRYSHLPKYLLFYDVAYAVDLQIYRITEAYPEFSFIPAGREITGNGRVLYRCRRRNESTNYSPIPGPKLSLGDSGCLVEDDSVSVLFIQDAENCREVSGMRAEIVSVIVIRIENPDDLDWPRFLPRARHLVVSVSGGVDLSNSKSFNEIGASSGARWGIVSVLSPGEDVILDPKPID